VNRNKNRDIIRAVLPSCARKWARLEGRHIARIRRRAVKEALANVGPWDEWDECMAFARVGKRMATARSKECERVSMRRDADKLGPLKRLTKYHKRRADNDEEAFEELCKIIRPSQNLITRHAMGHVEQWLDLEKDKYRYMWKRRKPDVQLLNRDGLVRIVTTLFETRHAKLNKILKANGYLLQRKCKDDSPCQGADIYTDAYHEVYDTFSKKWYAYNPRYPLSVANKKTRIRKVERRYPYHIARKCPNTLLIRTREDIEKLVNALCTWRGFSAKALQGTDLTSVILKGILELAVRMDLISSLQRVS